MTRWKRTLEATLQCAVQAASVKMDVHAMVIWRGKPGQCKRSLNPERSRRNLTCFIELMDCAFCRESHASTEMACSVMVHAWAEVLQQAMDATLSDQRGVVACWPLGEQDMEFTNSAPPLSMTGKGAPLTT